MFRAYLLFPASHSSRTARWNVKFIINTKTSATTCTFGSAARRVWQAPPEYTQFRRSSRYQAGPGSLCRTAETGPGVVAQQEMAFSGNSHRDKEIKTSHSTFPTVENRHVHHTGLSKGLLPSTRPQSENNRELEADFLRFIFRFDKISHIQAFIDQGRNS